MCLCVGCKLINIRWTDIQPLHSQVIELNVFCWVEHHPSEFFTCGLNSWKMNHIFIIKFGFSVVSVLLKSWLSLNSHEKTMFSAQVLKVMCEKSASANYKCVSIHATKCQLIFLSLSYSIEQNLFNMKLASGNCGISIKRTLVYHQYSFKYKTFELYVTLLLHRGKISEMYYLWLID